MIYYTYYLKHLKTGVQYYGVKYGKNCDPAKFWKPNGYLTSSKIIRKLVKEEGLGAFHAEIRRFFTCKKEAVAHEQRFLRKVVAPYSPLWFNQAYGTGPYLDKFGNRKSTKGVPKSEEHKRKISEAHKGKKHPRTAAWTAKIARSNVGKEPWNKGGTHTEEVRKKMSETRKGQKAWNKGKLMTQEEKDHLREARGTITYTEEQREAISERQRGRKKSEESKQKTSASLKGKPKSPEHRQKLSEAAKGRKKAQRTHEHAKAISEALQRRKAAREAEQTT